MTYVSNATHLLVFLCLAEVFASPNPPPVTSPPQSAIAHHHPGVTAPPELKFESQVTRKRRCLGTIVSLLWPQVVGPVDDGVIAERGFDEIPKTLLEYKLDRIRKKAKEEEASRLAVRQYMQRRFESVNRVDMPYFHGNRVKFVDLVHRIPSFLGLVPEKQILIVR